MRDATDITIVLDKSGSMGPQREETLINLNKFITDQKELPGECHLTLVQFNGNYGPVLSGPLFSFEPVTNYHPEGWTALLDAIGRSIVATGERLAKLSEKKRPNKVIFVILTDGAENSSKEYNFAIIKEMITHQQTKYEWGFVFLGAGLEAFNQGATIGTYSANTINFAMANPAAYGQTFSTLSTKMAQTRSSPVGGAVGMSNLNWSEQEKAEVDKP